MTHVIAGEIMSREITPFALRMRPELRKKVEEAAAENKRSLNAEISGRLESTFDIEDSVREVAPGCPINQVAGLLRHMHDERGDAVDNMEDVTRSVYAKQLEENLSLNQQLLAMVVMQNTFPDIVTENHRETALRLVQSISGEGEPAEMLAKIMKLLMRSKINKDFTI